MVLTGFNSDEVVVAAGVGRLVAVASVSISSGLTALLGLVAS